MAQRDAEKVISMEPDNTQVGTDTLRWVNVYIGAYRYTQVDICTHRWVQVYTGG